MTLNDWIVWGDVGEASKTMWGIVTGAITKDNIKYYNVAIPHDSGDFESCFNLYFGCQLTQDDLDKIADVCPQWKPFVDNWKKLCDMWCEELPMVEYLGELAVKVSVKVELIEKPPIGIDTLSTPPHTIEKLDNITNIKFKVRHEAQIVWEICRNFGKRETEWEKSYYGAMSKLIRYIILLTK